jgi:hypothetical protein
MALLMLETISASEYRGCALSLCHSRSLPKAPKLVARGHAVEREHVSQTGQVASHDGFAEKHGGHAELAENGGLAAVEHPDLAPGGGRAMVGTLSEARSGEFSIWI